MQTSDLYRRYLLHDRLAKLINRAGGEIYSIDDRFSNWKPKNLAEYLEKSWGTTVMVQTSAETPERNEEIAEGLLVILDDLPCRIKRDSGSLWLYAYLSDEPVAIYFAGGGVCERVVVGQRVVPAKPEHTVDIYEYRCPDPIVAAGLAE